ncbi:MAG: hypothetical protein SVK08_00620 [Halobacteriota archaeon]|nr:hypothetical protein [Halobacteriota archaeon]
MKQMKRMINKGTICGMLLFATAGSLVYVFISMWICGQVTTTEDNVAFRTIETTMVMIIMAYGLYASFHFARRGLKSSRNPILPPRKKRAIKKPINWGDVNSLPRKG